MLRGWEVSITSPNRVLDSYSLKISSLHKARVTLCAGNKRSCVNPVNQTFQNFDFIEKVSAVWLDLEIVGFDNMNSSLMSTNLRPSRFNKTTFALIGSIEIVSDFSNDWQVLIYNEPKLITVTPQMNSHLSSSSDSSYKSCHMGDTACVLRRR